MWNSYQEDSTGTAVIYGGRTGTCQQYAEWIGERRDAELIELQSAKLSRIKSYKTLIYILPIYDGQIEGLGSLSINYPKLMKVTRSYADDMGGAEGAKRIAVLAVGLTPEKEAYRCGLLDLPSVLEEVPVYYAMGRYLPEKADSRTALRLDILRKAMDKDPESVPAWFRNLCTSMGDEKTGGLNLTDPAYVDPILDLIDGR
jgi:hypothetical protein